VHSPCADDDPSSLTLYRLASQGNPRAYSVSGVPLLALRKLSGFSAIILAMPAAGQPPRKADELRVLVVDDDQNIADVLSMALRYEDFAVGKAGTGREALRQAEEFRPHIIILDVMLPDLDGFEVAKRLEQRRSQIPILFLTARDTTEDKVRGLTLGGDDYVTKPFSVEEILARIRTILRRAGLAQADGSHLAFADLELDDDTREVTRGGQLLELTDTEYRLLRYLLLHPRHVLTRAQILDHVWEYDFGGDARVLETYVSYLRKKLERTGPRLIHTVRGVGYALRTPRS
jgi:two-component system OmpR family response regulator